MKVSVEWLREYADLPDRADELVDVLPMLGIEVEEGEEDSGPTLENVVVGEVLSKDPHPEADRLSVVRSKSVRTNLLPSYAERPISLPGTVCRSLCPEPNFPAVSKSRNRNSGALHPKE